MTVSNKMHGLLDYLWRYALGSAGAVLADYALFILFIRLGEFEPGWANLLSTSVGFALAWIISGKTIFRSYGISLRGYAIWFGYQALAIPLYSLLVQYLVGLCGNEYLVKLGCIGVSFVVNSVFFKFVVLVQKNDKKGVIK